MNKQVGEKRVVDVLISHLRKDSHVVRELRHYEKRIDIVVLPFNSHKELWAIEAKVTNWERAIKQAVVNLAAAERSFIAMPASFAHRVPIEALDVHGIGLIIVGPRWGEVTISHNAKFSPYVNQIVAARIKAQLVGRVNI